MGYVTLKRLAGQLRRPKVGLLSLYHPSDRGMRGAHTEAPEVVGDTPVAQTALI